MFSTFSTDILCFIHTQGVPWAVVFERISHYHYFSIHTITITIALLASIAFFPRSNDLEPAVLPVTVELGSPFRIGLEVAVK